MNTHLVSYKELSYTYSSSSSVTVQSLLLALISNLRTLNCLCRVGAILSQLLSSVINLYHHALCHRSAKSMAHAHVLSEVIKVEARKRMIQLVGFASGLLMIYSLY